MSLEEARLKVQEAESKLQEVYEELDRIEHTMTDGLTMVGYFKEFYGNQFNAEVKRVFTTSEGYIISVKYPTSRYYEDCDFASQIVMEKIHKLGYYLGCVRPRDGHLELSLFKA